MAELRFDGRVAIVTGAGRGIGREHALLLARRGARVVVNNRSAEAADSVVAEILAAGGEAVAHGQSISSRAGAESLLATAMQAFGRVDIVVNNAGVLDFQPFEEISDATRDAMLAVHLLGAWDISRLAWRHMAAQRYGRVIMTVSSAALWGMPDNAHYCAAKGALIGLTKALAHEGAAHGIQVNALAVGGATRMIEERVQDPAYLSWSKRAIPASAASFPMAWLVHETCETSGEIFTATGRWMSRVFIANSNGFAPEGEYSPEAIRDNFSAVMNTDGFELYASVADHAAAIAKRVKVPFEGPTNLGELGGSETSV